MAARTGSANLPLHGGHVPAWLGARMAKLGRVIVEAIALEYGRDEVLRRLSHPFWFQAFGSVMGMDWHSSGITTSVLGALKRGLQPVESELGIYVCGGRGKQSRKTPAELMQIGERTGLDSNALVRTSRLIAKIDSAAVQDGHQLYLHGFVLSESGTWTIVQQGMNTETRTARRYHWLSEGLESFVDNPHAAIAGENAGQIVNLADRRAHVSRSAQLALVDDGPDRVVSAVRKLRSLPAPEPEQPLLPHLDMPAHHEVRASDVLLKRLHATLCAAREAGPKDFSELLLIPGVGARTVEALAHVAEVVHGAPYRFSDPARFSFAHGGKDGRPFPVPLRVYDRTLHVLRDAVERAKLGNDERLAALRNLDKRARELERFASGPEFDAIIEREQANSREFGGRTVFE